MLLVISAQPAASVRGLGAQIELRGCEHPLGRSEGVAGNRKTPTLSFVPNETNTFSESR